MTRTWVRRNPRWIQPVKESKIVVNLIEVVGLTELNGQNGFR